MKRRKSLSAYNVFKKKLMNSEEIKSIPVKRRFAYVAEKWRETDEYKEEIDFKKNIAESEEAKTMSASKKARYISAKWSQMCAEKAKQKAEQKSN